MKLLDACIRQLEGDTGWCLRGPGWPFPEPGHPLGGVGGPVFNFSDFSKRADLAVGSFCISPWPMMMAIAAICVPCPVFPGT